MVPGGAPRPLFRHQLGNLRRAGEREQRRQVWASGHGRTVEVVEEIPGLRAGPARRHGNCEGGEPH